MRFSASAATLAQALTTARHAVPSTPSIVAYSGLLVVVVDGKATVTGSDGETTISATVEATNTVDGQSLLAPKPLSDFLAKLNSDCIVEVELDAGDVEVRPDGYRPYRFRPLAATFPTPPPPKATKVPVDLHRLGAAVTAIRSAVDRDTTGVQLVSSATGLVLYSTDTYRAHRAELPEAGFGDFVGVVSLSVLERIARSAITDVAVDTKGRTLWFNGPGLTVTSRLLAPSFPAVEGVLSVAFPSSAPLDVAALRVALSRLESVAGASPVTVTLDGLELTLSVTNPDLGSGTEQVALERRQPAPFSFAVNLDYLDDALAAHQSDSVTLSWADPLQPLLLSSTDPLLTKSLLMPVRL